MHVAILLVGIAALPIFAFHQSFEGRCPFDKVPTVKDFQPQQYQGSWYTIRRYSSSYENFCVHTKYTWKEQAKQFQLDVEERVENVHRYYSMDATKDSAANDAKFRVKFNETRKGPYWIVATDYNSYSLIWGCIDETGGDTERYTQGLWVLGRSRSQNIHIETLNTILAREPFLADKLIDVEQGSTCTASAMLPSIVLSLIAISLSKLF